MKVLKMCCNADGVFVQMADDSLWWRRHDWLGDDWAAVGPPGIAATRRRNSVRRVGAKTATPARRSRR